MAASTQGSWYPSGFHGHFRSKIRNDFVNDYRQQAKPSPPLKFVKRLSEKPSGHQFSHHDNRFSFLNTVTSFQDGLGKRKLQGKHTNIFRPDFIAWVPHTREIREMGPSVSSYRNDFKETLSAPVHQILIDSVKRPNTANPIVPQPPIDERPITTYRFVHRHLQPNPKVNTNMNTGEVEDAPVPSVKSNQYINVKVPSVYDRKKQHPSLTRLRRSRAASAPPIRESVAMCLQWYRPESEKVTPLQLVGRGGEINVNQTSTSASQEVSLPSMPFHTQTAPAGLQHTTLQATPLVPADIPTAPSMSTTVPESTYSPPTTQSVPPPTFDTAPQQQAVDVCLAE
ncbi:uncharacterized protein [Ptychodera flava]|uniref:uncharacterized protein n=1 Tax=Ptychodera flava TaxID=63121 RepID=UPI003969FF9C